MSFENHTAAHNRAATGPQQQRHYQLQRALRSPRRRRFEVLVKFRCVSRGLTDHCPQTATCVKLGRNNSLESAQNPDHGELFCTEASQRKRTAVTYRSRQSASRARAMAAGAADALPLHQMIRN